MMKKIDDSAIAQPLTRQITPEQEAAREQLRQRQEAIQVHGIKAPASGTFGKGVPDQDKRKGKGA